MSSAILTVALDASLIVFTLGVAWRAWRWLQTDIGPDARSAGPLSRLTAIARTAASAAVGRRALRVLGAFALDALFLRRLFRRARTRAIAHHVLLAGFMWLLLVHALAPVLASRFLPGYQPTLDPWLFLRDFFGAAALAGVLFLAFARRPTSTAGSPKRSAGETTFIALLVLMLVSGFLLEAQKIASSAAFERMADVYAAGADPDQRAMLRAWWGREFGIPFEHTDTGRDATSAAQGRALHDEACASCHASPASAFVSWPLSRVFAPFARALDAADAGAWLLYLHALACIAALASLPFTRFLHAIASPFALLLDAVARNPSLPEHAPSAAFLAAQRAVALDACVHCRICDTTCSVAPLSRWLRNDAALPSRKLEILGDVARRGLRSFDNMDEQGRRYASQVAEGAFLCTDCGRCTQTCPVGLDLADLWQASRRDFTGAGIGPPDQWIQAPTLLGWTTAMRAQVPHAQPSPLRLATDRTTLARCIQCQLCTDVCPVIAHSTGGHADFTPQRVVNLLRLGRDDLALGSRMVRTCAGCYQCQEHCPERIPLADILLELRAAAPRALGAVRDHEGPP